MAWREKNKESIALSGKTFSAKYRKLRINYYRFKNYGLSELVFAEMLEKQNHRCRICGDSGKGGTGKFPTVDHCHKTNTVRGILCGRCNTGIGFFKDSPALCIMAARYLYQFDPKNSPKIGRESKQAKAINAL
ncbi:MAG: endonuclease VII domain-containing protein [Patescibacteria group bacterium]